MSNKGFFSNYLNLSCLIFFSLVWKFMKQNFWSFTTWKKIVCKDTESKYLFYIWIAAEIGIRIRIHYNRTLILSTVIYNLLFWLKCLLLCSCCPLWTYIPGQRSRWSVSLSYLHRFAWKHWFYSMEGIAASVFQYFWMQQVFGTGMCPPPPRPQ